PGHDRRRGAGALRTSARREPAGDARVHAHDDPGLGAPPERRAPVGAYVSRMLPIAVAALVVVLWHLTVVATGVAPYLLPPPLAVARETWAHAGELAAATLRTGTAAAVALAASVVGGLGVAFVFAQAPLVARSLYPYAIFLQTVPIVAIAPLVI